MGITTGRGGEVLKPHPPLTSSIPRVLLRLVGVWPNQTLTKIRPYTPFLQQITSFVLKATTFLFSSYGRQRNGTARMIAQLWSLTLYISASNTTYQQVRYARYQTHQRHLTHSRAVVSAAAMQCHSAAVAVGIWLPS